MYTGRTEEGGGPVRVAEDEDEEEEEEEEEEDDDDDDDEAEEEAFAGSALLPLSLLVLPLEPLLLSAAASSNRGVKSCVFFSA